MTNLYDDTRCKALLFHNLADFTWIVCSQSDHVEPALTGKQVIHHSQHSINHNPTSLTPCPCGSYACSTYLKPKSSNVSIPRQTNYTHPHICWSCSKNPWVHQGPGKKDIEVGGSNVYLIFWGRNIGWIEQEDIN